jgi:hypothetical protein
MCCYCSPHWKIFWSKKVRWLLFFLVILIGAGLGVFYTWRINPVEYEEASLDSLRSDYKTDYVLMVAEIYEQESDLGGVIRRLARLTLIPADEIVSQAIVSAEKQGYRNKDIVLMRILFNNLQTQPAGLEGGSP